MIQPDQPDQENLKQSGIYRQFIFCIYSMFVFLYPMTSPEIYEKILQLHHDENEKKMVEIFVLVIRSSKYESFKKLLTFLKKTFFSGYILYLFTNIFIPGPIPIFFKKEFLCISKFSSLYIHISHICFI